VGVEHRVKRLKEGMEDYKVHRKGGKGSGDEMGVREEGVS
jgi:hypothetical protein